MPSGTLLIARAARRRGPSGGPHASAGARPGYGSTTSGPPASRGRGFRRRSGSTTLSFVSLIFWTWVIGPLGALLAISLTLLAKAILIDADPSLRWVRPLISNQADPYDVPSQFIPMFRRRPDARRDAGGPDESRDPRLVELRPRRADLRADLFAGLPGAISSVPDGMAAACSPA